MSSEIDSIVDGELGKVTINQFDQLTGIRLVWSLSKGLSGGVTIII